MRKAVLICLILGLGLLVTLLSGLYRRDFSTGDATDIRYGLPFSWHGERGLVDSNGLTSWYALDNLVYDILSWSFVFAIFALMTRRRK